MTSKPAPLNLDTAEPEARAATPAIAPRSASFFARLFRHKKALVGGLIILVFVAIAVLAPVIAPGNPAKIVARPNQPPSAKYLLGTTGQGHDMFKEIVWGTRLSLTIGVLTGLLTTAIGVSIGLIAGYFSGWIDDLLSLMINIVLIIPSLPLLVVLASFLKPSPVTIMIVLAILGWAWPARVFRAQVLALREKDFVAAAQVSGESSLRIMFREILPNMTSLVVSGLIGSIMYAIGAEASLEFLGLGDVSVTSWGTILFWAQNNSAFLLGAWWTFVPAGLCIAVIAFGLAMLNYTVDEITNPRLRTEKEIVHGLKFRFRTGQSTPVVRASDGPAARRA